MKLSEYAKSKGLTYKTAWRLYKKGEIPHLTEQLPTGTIIVYPNQSKEQGKNAIYASVSSHDQKPDLERQLQRLRNYCAEMGLVIDREITEIGSALNGKRKKLLRLLADDTIKTIVVEHQDRLTRFGFEYLEASLQALNRKIIVINKTECKDDLVQDMIDVLTSFCARLYGRRSAKRRAKKALAVCQA
ncbi:MAG: IS607 family transposase [Candidatus Heimdallarchaeota archaeon]